MSIGKLLKAGVVLPFLLFGCGDNNSAPAGSTITINPDGAKWDVSAGTCNGTEVNFHAFNITVRNSAGVELNDTDLYITLDLASNNFTLPPYMQLYDDPNWQGGITTLPQNPVSTPYVTKTGASGTKRIIVGVDLGCGYKGSLTAYSGSSVDSVSIDVTES